MTPAWVYTLLPRGSRIELLPVNPWLASYASLGERQCSGQCLRSRDSRDRLVYVKCLRQGKRNLPQYLFSLSCNPQGVKLAHKLVKTGTNIAKRHSGTVKRRFGNIPNSNSLDSDELPSV
ncbi:uncharacterized protein LOC143182063 [Calliopsis andreniformis]|uniref:uncharacterized protein LOC143182063 n=1 Tax=Calliopsis andreniformis TaxID=337506 RepID=UPI003FCE2CF2